MMSLWDALRMNMMISYQELVRTFPSFLRLHQERPMDKHPMLKLSVAPLETVLKSPVF